MKHHQSWGDKITVWMSVTMRIELYTGNWPTVENQLGSAGGLMGKENSYTKYPMEKKNTLCYNSTNTCR